MSRKTVIIKKKIDQFIRKNARKPIPSDLLPFSVAKSDGRKKINGLANSTDEDGKPQKAGRLYDGRATNKIGTMPISAEKSGAWWRFVK